MTVRDPFHFDAVQPREAETPRQAPVKKAFVEPAISSPVDVLEATTFFQVVDSGGTGFRRRRPTD